MRIIFRDLNPQVAAAVAEAFADVPEVDAACADIFTAGPADAIISPANSFGRMVGGIDAVYVRKFGSGLQDIVTLAFCKQPCGLLPVGKAVVVPTGSANIPRMISAPTMRVPGPVADTRNAYLAFRAALWCAQDYGFETLLCPGLATLCGRMAPDESARQMRRAWDHVVAGNEFPDRRPCTTAAVGL